MTSMPERAVLVRLVEASLENAARLVGDAEILRVAGSAPTAHSLAVLSLEETGKAWLCRSAMQDGFALTPEEFRKQFISHRAKLGYVLPALALLATFADLVGARLAGREPLEAVGEAEWPAFIEAQATSHHARKMSGFYVDVDASHQIVEPTVITEEEAIAAIQAASVAQALVSEIPLPVAHSGPILLIAANPGQGAVGQRSSLLDPGGTP